MARFPTNVSRRAAAPCARDLYDDERVRMERAEEVTVASDGEVQEFEESLRAAGLGHCFEALKGGPGAVRLTHVRMLKEKATEGRAALEAALAEHGVASGADRERLSALLIARLEAHGTIAPKPVPAPAVTRGTEAWRAAVADDGGALPPELAALEESHAEPHVDGGAGASEADAWAPGMRIVNAHLAHSIREQGMIQPPNHYGYIHLAGEVERPRILRGTSREKKALLADLKVAARALREGEPSVRRADVFDAFLIPPGSEEGRAVIANGHHDVHIAELDVVVLVECEDVEAAARVRRSAAFAALEERLARAARYLHCITAKNTKRIAEVDKDRDGVFLFNYFYAADIEAKGSAGVDVLLGVWEYTAGWWTAKANLTNSTPLQPLPGERSEYSLINHCRWDRLVDVLPHLVFRPSLGSFVLANFTANDIMAMPVLYHLA